MCVCVRIDRYSVQMVSSTSECVDMCKDTRDCMYRTVFARDPHAASLGLCKYESKVV